MEIFDSHHFLKFHNIFNFKNLFKLKNIFTLQNYGYSFIVIVIYILYVLALFGLSSHAPAYIKTIDYYVRIYIGVFLIWRFSLASTVHFNDLDKRIAAAAGWFIVFSTFLNQLIENYYTKAKTYVTTINEDKTKSQ